MTRLRAHGLEVTVPQGWHGSITRTLGAQPGEDGVTGTTNPVVHVSTRPLPGVRGDFGGGAVESMGPHDLFLALVEFDPEARHTPLFAQHGLRPLTADGFRRETMHRPVPAQSGHQQFFVWGDRAFCLYVALGSHRRRAVLARAAQRVASTLHPI